ncbi:ATP-binding cassette domain-containing protein [Halobellus sp. GM3]|uniref:ATP-binding cassette domain-containing protein n=1 Tax=Halobellus sp. GM3 TaxID=3458410 RepID=UPI00403D8D80
MAGLNRSGAATDADTGAGSTESGPTATSKVVVDGVNKVFESKRQRVEALSDVNFAVSEGEFVCLVGPSGCGKTTLFRMIAGLEAPSAGEIRLDGERVTGPGTDRGMIFQEYGLFPWRTVRDNVAFGLEEQGIDDPERSRRVEEMLALVGLSEFAGAYPKELSGGMKQRVGIARALAVDPEILLADEPFGSVDAQTRDMLHEELLGIWAETGKTVLFVTHDVEEAVTLADRVVVMAADPGRVRDVIDVSLDRPRERTAPAFGERVEQIRGLIGE